MGFLAQETMSLIFGGATTDVVSVAAHASLNNLATKTVLLWVYVTTLTTNRAYWGKNTGNFFNHSGSTGNIRVGADRSSGDSNYITNNTPVALNTWTCVAFTYDNAATPPIHIYTGTVLPLVEATYGTATDGSGSVVNDSGSAMLWGNRSAIDAAIQGRIAVGMMWNRVLTLGELRAQQFNPHMTAGCVDFKIFGFNGVDTQPDYSGNLNAGTVTGATVGPHAPLPPAFGFSGGWLGNFTAAVAAGGWGQLLSGKRNRMVM